MTNIGDTGFFLYISHPVFSFMSHPPPDYAAYRTGRFHISHFKRIFIHYPGSMTYCAYHVIPQLDRLELKRVVAWQHTFSWHMHDSYVLGIVTQGTARFTTSVGTHWVPPLSISVIHPQQAHSGPVHHQQAITQNTCYPSVSLMQSVAEEELGRRHQMPWFATQVIADEELARTILDVHDQLCGGTIAESLTRRVLATLMDRYATFIPEEDYWQSTGTIRRVCIHLRTHYPEPVSIRQLTEVAGGISEVHLIRQFRQQVGMPPYAYLTYRRVEEAKQRLQQHLPTAQTALEVGFTDQSHLTRQFKKMLGITPGAYRKLYASS